jgi:hypothetical protein
LRWRHSHERACVAKGKPFNPSSEARFVKLELDGRVPAEVSSQGFEYLLETEEVQLILEDISEKRISPSAMAEYVIHYATYDTYPSWISDIPS